MACDTCNDTGWTGWHKPIHGRMVFIPQLCTCVAAEAAASRYEQNLKAGKAGRHGELHHEVNPPAVKRSA